MTKMYLRHKETGRKFKVLGFNKETGKITLEGEHAVFEEDFNKEKLKELGYDLLKE